MTRQNLSLGILVVFVSAFTLTSYTTLAQEAPPNVPEIKSLHPDAEDVFPNLKGNIDFKAQEHGGVVEGRTPPEQEQFAEEEPLVEFEDAREASRSNFFVWLIILIVLAGGAAGYFYAQKKQRPN